MFDIKYLEYIFNVPNGLYYTIRMEVKLTTRE